MRLRKGVSRALRAMAKWAKASRALRVLPHYNLRFERNVAVAGSVLMLHVQCSPKESVLASIYLQI